MAVRLRLLLPLAVVLAACGSSDHPYKVSFVNDTELQVEVVGCPDCGAGHVVAVGQSWNTSLKGGAEDVIFRSGGVKVGCVHFINGALPEKGDPPSVIRVASYSPCRS
jgi:hypothetical protein